MDGDLITADGQLEYRGILLGDNENTFLDAITGWEDLPGIDTGSTPRASGHGSFPGRLRSGERIVTWSGYVAPWVDLQAAVQDIRTATEISDTTEYPVVVRTLTETMLAFGRVVKRSLPQNRMYAAGGGELALQWLCSDPLRYSVAEHSATTGPAAGSTGGLTFPLTFPLTFGTGASGGLMTAVNAGSAYAPLVLEVEGPATGISISDPDTGNVLGFAASFTVASGQTLTIDGREKTVLLNGVSRRDQLVTAQWLTLAPGANRLIFNATSGTGTARARWRDAWF